MPVFFTSNRTFGDYFQLNTWIYFLKLCSWTTCSDAKLIKNVLILMRLMAMMISQLGSSKFVIKQYLKLRIVYTQEYSQIYGKNLILLQCNFLPNLLPILGKHFEKIYISARKQLVWKSMWFSTTWFMWISASLSSSWNLSIVWLQSFTWC